MDVFDRATELEEIHRERSLGDQLGKGAIKPPRDWDGVNCYCCGEDIIPPARKQLGYFTCIDCESYLEQVREKNRKTVVKH